jgi:hypothetical protein
VWSANGTWGQKFSAEGTPIGSKYKISSSGYSRIEQLSNGNLALVQGVRNVTLSIIGTNGEIISSDVPIEFDGDRSTDFLNIIGLGEDGFLAYVGGRTTTFPLMKLSF